MFSPFGSADMISINAVIRLLFYIFITVFHSAPMQTSIAHNQVVLEALNTFVECKNDIPLNT